MPLYVYKRSDGSVFEIQQKMSEPALKRDPVTGLKVQRVLQPPTIIFRGKGFYSTDYGPKES
jgi:predicted nucleic acid-binding Zn ribbon protein